MARKSHPPPPGFEDLGGNLNVRVTMKMHAFLELEAKRITEDRGKKFSKGDVVRALITSYYEKRVANLVTNPDD